MPDHKFVYTVSGVRLSGEQQARISQAIGVAVASVLAGEEPGPARSNFLNLFRIYGGLWIDVAEAEKIGLQNVLNSQPAQGPVQAT